ncbi:hypothetical protein ACA910_011378 [Epithemia clementina (nom. ined.)]
MIQRTGDAFGGTRRAATTTTFRTLMQRHDEESESQPVASNSEETPFNFFDFEGFSIGEALTGELFFPKALLWEPSRYFEDSYDENDDDDESTWFGDEDFGCYIADEFKVDEQVAADALAYLGIQRVQPILFPAFDGVGDFQ